MRTDIVTESNVDRFIEYCSRYGKEHDESFLPDDAFAVSTHQPSYLLWDDHRVVGAVSLIRTQGYIDAKRGRFSIFHSVVPSLHNYSELYQAISQHFDGLDRVYLFVPQDAGTVRGVLAKLGFQLERFVYVLCLQEPQPRSVHLEESQIISVSSDDELRIETFVEVTNRSFGDSRGGVELTSDDVRSWFAGNTTIDDGILLLYHEESPVGAICVFRDDVDNGSAVIEYLSIREGYRGKGLGRQLLRCAISFAFSHNLRPVYLTVNGENDSAIRLYLSEGFRPEKTVACYSRDVRM